MICLLWYVKEALHKKWSFPLRISSVNVNKSGFGHIYWIGHIYWRNPEWKTSFCVQWSEYETSDFWRKIVFSDATDKDIKFRYYEYIMIQRQWRYGNIIAKGRI